MMKTLFLVLLFFVVMVQSSDPGCNSSDGIRVLSHHRSHPKSPQEPITWYSGAVDNLKRFLVTKKFNGHDGPVTAVAFRKWHQHLKKHGSKCQPCMFKCDLVANLPFFSNRNGPYRPPEKVKLFDNCQNGKWYAYNCVQSHRCKALHKMSLQEIKVGFDICQEINKCQPNSHMLVHKSLEIFYAFKHGHIFFEA